MPSVRIKIDKTSSLIDSGHLRLVGQRPSARILIKGFALF